MSRSITSPSIWWNTGMCVASGVSRRNDPAGGDDVDRGLAVEHRADLHRRRVRAEHGRARRRAGVVDEQGVELVARRVAGRHVERLEVVPVGLHLGTLGHREPEPDEDVLEALPRLRDDVGVAAAGGAGELGEVEPFGGDAARRARPRPARRGARAMAAASSAWAAFSACPAALRSSTVASAPRPVLIVASGPRLPSTCWSMATTSSNVVAAAMSASAASRAARISSITAGFPSSERAAPAPSIGVSRCGRVSPSRSPGGHDISARWARRSPTPGATRGTEIGERAG